VKGTVECSASISIDGWANGQLVKRFVGQTVLGDAAEMDPIQRFLPGFPGT